ncbi:MAG: FkbM family methyltransferase [bacterium]
MKIKIFIARMLTISLIGKILSYFYNDKIPFRGMVFNTSIPEISPATKAELFWKIYESAEIRFIQKYLPESFDVIELGSSIGVVSSLIRKRLYKNACLICVEAHPALSRHIPVNLNLNRLYHNVECLNMAINYNKKSNNNVFFTPGHLSTTGRLTCGNPQHNSIMVKAVTLFELKSAYHINDFVLIADIEGEEVYIIRQDREALRDCQHIFFELHNTTYAGVPVSVDDMLKELIDIHGFYLQDRHDNVVYLNRNTGTIAK